MVLANFSTGMLKLAPPWCDHRRLMRGQLCTACSKPLGQLTGLVSPCLLQDVHLLAR